jgi:hypothetical protein
LTGSGIERKYDTVFGRSKFPMDHDRTCSRFHPDLNNPIAAEFWKGSY